MRQAVLALSSCADEAGGADEVNHYFCVTEEAEPKMEHRF
jgi:hypothetical protein